MYKPRTWIKNYLKLKEQFLSYEKKLSYIGIKLVCLISLTKRNAAAFLIELKISKLQCWVSHPTYYY